MSDKLLKSLQYGLSKVVPQKLAVVWEDSLFRLHAVFYGNEFLNNSEQEIIKTNTREILIHNRKNKPNYSYTCLPYELRKQVNCAYGTNLCMDYVIGFHTKSDDFEENGIDLLTDRLLSFERNFLDQLELVSDTDTISSSDDSL